MSGLNFSIEIVKSLENLKKNCIIVVGDEPVTKNHVDVVIQEYLKIGHFDQINITIDKTTKLESIQPLFMDGSLFNNHTYFRINILNGRISEEVKQFVASAIKTNTMDLFKLHLNSTIKDFSKTIWSKELQKTSIVLEAFEPKSAQIKEVVMARAKFHQILLSQDSINILIGMTEGNFLLLENELKKLRLLFNSEEINIKQLLYHLSNGSRYDAFELLNACMSGDKKRVIDALVCLQEEGSDALSVNGLYAWIFKAVAKFKFQNKKNPNFQDYSSMRIFGSAQTNVKRSLEAMTKSQIEGVLSRIKDIDLICKGIKYGDPWLELNRLSFGLARIHNKLKI